MQEITRSRVGWAKGLGPRARSPAEQACRKYTSVIYDQQVVRAKKVRKIAERQIRKGARGASEM